MLIITNDDEDVEESFREYRDAFNVTLSEGVDFVSGDGEWMVVDLKRDLFPTDCSLVKWYLNPILLSLPAGLSTLLWQAENPKYSTVLYVLSRKNSSDVGLCDMSGSMSQAFNKTIIIWPCPKMKVSGRRFAILNRAVLNSGRVFNC